MVKNGESTFDSDYIIPTRENFATVYNFLLSAARLGKERFRISRLLADIMKENSNADINYVKLKCIIKVFRELNIVSIEEIDNVTFAFHISYTKNKTSLDKSSILRRLKTMYPKSR